MFDEKEYINIIEKFKIDGYFNFISENKEIVSKELFVNYYPDLTFLKKIIVIYLK